jgi:hypothetical protein
MGSLRAPIPPRSCIPRTMNVTYRHGHERRPPAFVWCTETTMSSLVDALADENIKTRVPRPMIRQCRPCSNVLALNLFVAALSQHL